MATSSSPSKIILFSLTLLSTTLFFLLLPPPPHHRRRLQSPPSPPPHHNCSFTYLSLHFCLLSSNPLLSLPVLSLLLLFHFYFLIRTARDHFSPIVTLLSSLLRLSPSLAAVTLLSLGNGAPDLFASSAALRRGHPRTGLAAILSAGAFVSAFVVGSVVVITAPFALDPAPFVRDVFFYLLAVSALFYVYLSAEIYLWQAVGLIGFYVFFVGMVFWMDFVGRGKRKEEEMEVEMGLVSDVGEGIGGDGEGAKSRGSWFSMIKKVIVIHGRKLLLSA